MLYLPQQFIGGQQFVCVSNYHEVHQVKSVMNYYDQNVIMKLLLFSPMITETHRNPTLLLAHSIIMSDLPVENL
jgi:hypothetical protein